MKRREFITIVGGAATVSLARPLVARAQQAERVRRVGVLMGGAKDDPEQLARMSVFEKGLKQLGWVVGHNLQIDYRWGTNEIDDYRKTAAELVALAPDIVLAAASPSTAALLRATHSIPIVFVIVPDPVGAGFVESLARPGGNATGFMQFEYSLSGKWLELLKQVAPKVTRAAVIRDASNPAGSAQFAAIQAVASPLGMDVTPVNVHDVAEIERSVAAFARSPNGGLIATGGRAIVNRELIINLAARHRLPAVYPYRLFVAGGGLISYGPDLADQFRRAAGYVDRILKGEKSADLPVQAPTKYDLVINLKTAKALGLDVPPSVLARADEVIE